MWIPPGDEANLDTIATNYIQGNPEFNTDSIRESTRITSMHCQNNVAENTLALWSDEGHCGEFLTSPKLAISMAYFTLRKLGCC